MRRRLRALLDEHREIAVAVGVWIWLLLLGAPVWAGGMAYVLLVLLPPDDRSRRVEIVLGERAAAPSDGGDGA